RPRKPRSKRAPIAPLALFRALKALFSNRTKAAPLPDSSACMQEKTDDRYQSSVVVDVGAGGTAGGETQTTGAVGGAVGCEGSAARGGENGRGREGGGECCEWDAREVRGSWLGGRLRLCNGLECAAVKESKGCVPYRYRWKCKS
ncbi:hypothetical protein B0H17DRAFT_1103517, partial [Mycena rosella]